MAKMNRKDYARQTERQMRDQMNSIVRNEDGSIYSRNGIVKIYDKKPENEDIVISD